MSKNANEALARQVVDLERKVLELQRDKAMLERDNAQQRAEVDRLSQKLRGQIKRGNILKDRATGADRQREAEVPAGPMLQEARRAWGKAHPGVKVPDDAEVGRWLAEQHKKDTATA